MSFKNEDIINIFHVYHEVDRIIQIDWQSCSIFINIYLFIFTILQNKATIYLLSFWYTLLHTINVLTNSAS